MPPIDIVKITVSVWAHNGGNPDGNVGRDLPAIRLSDSSGTITNQPNAFEFYTAGYYFGDSTRRDFLMTTLYQGGNYGFQQVNTEVDSIPNDRWIYVSTTYDGTSGTVPLKITHFGTFFFCKNNPPYQ